MTPKRLPDKPNLKMMLRETPVASNNFIGNTKKSKWGGNAQLGQVGDEPVTTMHDEEALYPYF